MSLRLNCNFKVFLNILQQVEPPTKLNKIEPPSSVITCLVIQIDAKEGEISIPPKS